MLLENKNAIVYGAGPVGSAVARAFAREGARVFLASRAQPPLDATAAVVRAAGGRVDTAQVDVLDRDAVETHTAAVAATGAIDVVFNAVGNDDIQGSPLTDMDVDDVLRPVVKAIRAHHLIATAAARHMIGRRNGVILAMAGGREAIPNLGGSHAAWAALAGLCRQLAAELGPHGIRVAWLLSPGSPDTTPADDPDAAVTLLGRRPSYDDVGNVAAFAASDRASTMTATELNLTGGAVID
jgi:3-oxoacyl-[acyl-carrier protein] reductase